MQRNDEDNDKKEEKKEEAVTEKVSPPLATEKKEEKIEEKREMPEAKEIDILKTAKTLASHLTDDLTKYSLGSKNLLLNAAGKLDLLSAEASYQDIFNILKELKKAGLKTGNYRRFVAEKVTSHTKGTFSKLENDVKLARQNETSSEEVINSIIHYMKMLETQWKAETEANKYTGKKVENVKERINITKICYKTLEKIKDDVPLPLSKIAHIIDQYNQQMKHIDPKAASLFVDPLHQLITQYAASQLKVEEIILLHGGHVAHDHTVLVQQISSLNTPADKRLSQMVAAYSDRLTANDIRILNSYLTLKKSTSISFTSVQQEGIYQAVNGIRNKLRQVSNESTIPQAPETKKVDGPFVALAKEQIKHLNELANQYGDDKEFQKKLNAAKEAIKKETNSRIGNSDAKTVEKVKEWLNASSPPVEKKPQSKKEQEREKEIALAMLELRQGLMEERMVNPDALLEEEEIKKDKFLSDQTKVNYKNLQEKYGRSRKENFDLREYTQKIGTYKIGKKKDIEEPIGWEQQRELVLKMLGDNAYQKLHNDKIFETPAPKTARIHYLQYLQSALDAHRQQNASHQLLTMEKLLGAEGIQLYQAAMQEEENDPAFINAVFLKSVENFRGPKWAQKLVLWVAGPSSSGKTYATNGMIAKIVKSIMPKVTGQEDNDNYVVTIDGAVQRQVSQIRKLTVDTAIELGYCGIKDVDKGTKGKLKNKIQEAAEAAQNLSIAIPDTFTKHVGFNEKEKLKKLFNENAKNDQILQVYSQIRSGEGAEAEKTFERTVGRMGKARAFLKIGKKYYSITMDGRIIIESKKYDRGFGGINFSTGKRLAKLGKEAYREAQEENKKSTYDFDVIHDLIYIRFDEKSKKWVECIKSDEGEMRRTTRRAFAAWQEKWQEGVKKNNALSSSKASDLYDQFDAWSEDENGGNKPTLQDQMIEFSLDGERKDYEAENVLAELKKLKQEIDHLLSLHQNESNSSIELATIRQRGNAISEFIKIIESSLSAGDPIHKGRDHEKAMSQIKEELSLLIKNYFTQEMQKIGNWLNVEGGEIQNPQPDKPVDFDKLGKYMADLLSKKLPADEKKREVLANVITDLRNQVAGQANPHSYIKGCIERLKNLIPAEEIPQFKKIPLAYAAAQKREAYHAILDRKQISIVMADAENTEKKAAALLIAYLNSVENEWKVEEIWAGGYKDNTMSFHYNDGRSKLLKNAIEELKKTKEISDIQETIQSLTTKLGKIRPSHYKLSIGTNQTIESLKDFSNNFVNQIKAQTETVKSYQEAIKSIDKTVPDDKPVKEYMTGPLQKYLDNLKKEWEAVNALTPITDAQKNYNASRLQKLEVAMAAINTDKEKSPLKFLAILNKLKEDLRDVAILEDPELSRQTQQAIDELVKLQANCNDCFVHLYERWLEKPLTSSINEPEVQDLSTLSHYMTHLISKDYPQGLMNIIKELRAHSYTGSNEENQKFIHDVLSKLKNHESLDGLLVKHAQIVRRDIQTKIVNESPSAIIKKTGMDDPNAYHQHVAQRMIEYLLSIRSEWIAQELTSGVPTGKGSYAESRKQFIDESITALKKKEPIPNLSDIQGILKNLGDKLQEIPSQPIGLARIPYIFESRSRAGKKSAELVSQTANDISDISKISEKYITPFINELDLDKKDKKADEEHKKNMQETETRRLFLKGKEGSKEGKENKEIKGTATILQSLIQEVAEQQPLLVARQVRTDKNIKVEASENKLSSEAKAFDLTGWEAGNPENIQESTRHTAPSLNASSVKCLGLPSGMCIEYKKQDDDTTIRESHQSSYVKISVPTDPQGYVEMDEKKKLEVDIEIAEAMVRLWVARCGPPVPISDTPNGSRMRALIIVCEAYDIDYRLPSSSRYGHEFISAPKEQLKDSIAALIKKKASPIQTLKSSDKLDKLVEDFKHLEQYYASELKGKLNDTEKTHYEEEMKKLSKLISNAKEGKFNATAANDAIIELSASLEKIEFKQPAPQSSLRAIR